MCIADRQYCRLHCGHKWFKPFFFFLKDFKVDTFEYRLLREVSFRQSVTKRYLGEEDVKFTSSAHQGPVVAPQVLQKPRSSKLVEGSDATFTVKVSTAKDTRVRYRTILSIPRAKAVHRKLVGMCLTIFVFCFSVDMVQERTKTRERTKAPD